MMEPLVKIAIASDLHCHAPREDGPASFLTSGLDRIPVGKHPVEALRALVEKYSVDANILLCPGDITDRICKPGLHSGWDFLKEIGQCLNIELLVATLGNHDVDSRGGGDSLQTARALRPNEFPVKHQELRDEFWLKGYFLLQEGVCDILTINSVAGHFNETLAKRGSVAEGLLESLQSELAEKEARPNRVALVHHHPLPHERLALGSEDLMENGDELISVLEENNFGLIIHGHKHHPRLRYSSESSSGPAVFAAGSFSAFLSPYLAPNTRNLFHVIELVGEVEGCYAPGQIRSWEFNYTRGWSEPSHRSAGLPAIAGFGCRETPEAIARRMSKILLKMGERVVAWELVAEAIPSVDYLLPQDLRKLGEELKQYDVDLWPRPPERPENIVITGKQDA